MVVKLFGKEWTRQELEKRVGRIEQIAGVQRFSMKDGPEENVDSIRIRNGSGLSFWVTPSKGMDIALTEYLGTNINWTSSNGDYHSSYYDDHTNGWMKTASGGLLMTCGLSQVGGDGVDQFGPYGVHGRAHHTPARQISYSGEWVEDEYLMSVSGVIEETSIFGYHLKLTRKITCKLGENTISIDDKIENCGFINAPHMMLYHFNLGFPLLTENSIVQLPSGNVTPRDSGVQIDRIEKWEQPIHQFEEQVYYHEPKQTDDGIFSASVISPDFPSPHGLGATFQLKWEAKNLPKMVQWRMPGEREHVLGLEPSNCLTFGRTYEQETQTLKFLEPGEVIKYHLEISINENK